jgi:hypothetical protein
MYEVSVLLGSRKAIVQVEDHDVYQNYDDEGLPVGHPEIVFQYRVFVDDDEGAAEVPNLSAHERRDIYQTLLRDLEDFCDVD